MQITVSDANGVRVLSMAGRFDAAAGFDADRIFEQAVEDRPRAVVLDLAGVEYLSSGGIRAVIVLSRRCKEFDAPLKLCGLNPFVKQVLDLSKLTPLFDVYPTAADAVAACDSA